MRVSGHRSVHAPDIDDTPTAIPQHVDSCLRGAITYDDADSNPCCMSSKEMSPSRNVPPRCA